MYEINTPYGTVLDSPEEIGEGLEAIMANVKSFRTAIAQLRGKGYSATLHRRVEDLRNETQDLVLGMRDRINDMPLSQRNNKRMLVQRFKGILTEYQKVQDFYLQQERNRADHIEEQLARKDEEKAKKATQDEDHYSFSLEEMGIEEVNREMLLEKNEEIKGIELELTQISEVFKDMSNIVEEAAPQLDIIEDNVAEAKQAAKEGTTTLAQTVRSVLQSRWKMLLIAAIILLILIVVVVIIVVAATNA